MPSLVVETLIQGHHIRYPNESEFLKTMDIPTEPSRPSLWRRFLHGSKPSHTRFRIIGVALGAFLLFKFCLIPIKVVGFSMFPTYKPGEINYINRYAFSQQPPMRGDVVSIRTTGRQVTILKRVIGIPGDMIRMREGVVFVNAEKIDEPYVESEKGLSTRKPVRLGENEYWVVGDNRMISEFAKIHLRHIIGSPLF
ncbi:signal peptidase I [bacterium]|nr:signal peptidase I [bacterium]